MMPAEGTITCSRSWKNDVKARLTAFASFCGIARG
jgi:hypothetical protein